MDLGFRQVETDALGGGGGRDLEREEEEAILIK